MVLHQTLRLFLDSIGRREEYEFYLHKFQSSDTACFALLVPDFESLDQGTEALAFDLRFLLQLGLKPAVFLCGNDAKAKWNLLAENKLFEKVASISSFKTAQKPPEPGDLEQRDGLNVEHRVPVFVEEPSSVQPDRITLEKMIPTMAKRVHFIRAAGGLVSDYYYLKKENTFELTEEDEVLAHTAATLLEARPGTHISITSPMNLLEEIFTVKGAGTVFRQGSMILSNGLSDSDRLLTLLAKSFDRKPKASVLTQVTQVYYEENYRGAVLLERQPPGLYLSKFAVGPEARGEGLAQELWDDVCKKHPAFFWRTKKSNRVNPWYDRHSDGRHTAGDWVVFWRGMDANSLPSLILFCQNRPSDFL